MSTPLESAETPSPEEQTPLDVEDPAYQIEAPPSPDVETPAHIGGRNPVASPTRSPTPIIAPSSPGQNIDPDLTVNPSQSPDTGMSGTTPGARVVTVVTRLTTASKKAAK